MNDLPTPPTPGPQAEGSGTIEGEVLRILFVNEESGWAVVAMTTDDGDRLTTVGPLLGVREGDRLRITGRWREHPRYGRQLEADSFLQVSPSTRAGIRKFLGSGRIRGIGPAMAGRIVDRFGLETLEILADHPERLTEVRGIGKKTADRVRRSWEASRAVQEVMVFLHSHGVSPSVAAKVHKRYGAAALDVVRSNPYRLADEIFGVGFLTADRIAASLGIPKDAPERLRAGLAYSLGDAVGDGHVYLPAAELLDRASHLLEVPVAEAAPALDDLVTGGVLVEEEPTGKRPVYLPRLHEAEATVAARLGEIVGARRPGPALDVEKAVAWYQRRAEIELAPLQRRALAAALAEPAAVVTGGPGTGKTTLIRGVIEILTRKEQRVALAAPTGRAAKRLQETTGSAARTIHRLLEYNPRTHTFSRCRENPIEADLLVVDEASMLDIELAAALLEAVPPNCRLLLVGDADQLPSVGPGNVLADLISSGAVTVIRLHEIFRQARESLIVVNAHRVNQGDMPVAADSDAADFFTVARDDPGAAAETIVDLVTSRIPRRFQLDPVNDIQILSPMHRGELGVAALNDRLRAVLNPAGPELRVGSRVFRASDKVMQVRNNYDLEVFNGDLGRIMTIDGEEKTLVVDFDGRPVAVPTEGLDDLVPAYACTIHKSQGSEYPAVVVVLHHQHYIMLQRNLLYTAITRGKRLVVIVGSRRALARAVRNATQRRRYTRLAERIRQGDARRGM